MEDLDLYERLANHLDQGVIASPRSPHLTEILRILFPEDEARIAIKLPVMNTELSKLQELFPDLADNLASMLDRMAKRGTVFKSVHSGGEVQYRLLPPVVGWYEAPFAAGKETEQTRKLAPLWLKYREKEFGRELVRGNTPLMRVIPVSKPVKNPSGVVPYEFLRSIVEKQSFIAVTHCSCRQIKRNVDQGCDHSDEVCMHMESMGRYMVEHSMARRVEMDEALEILKKASQEGLVHTLNNIEGQASTICNCCGCCCVFLDTRKKLGLHSISTSGFVAQADSDACAACGVCEKRCPMEAVTVIEEAARVNGDLCIGCGVCTTTCPTGAVELKLRGQPVNPPSLKEFLAARYKKETIL